MTRDEFIQKICKNEDDEKKALFFFESKGIDLHVSIYEYLLSLKNTDVDYCEIATTFRYDKKIRKILYKFISFFEEYIRACICNKYSTLHSLELTNIVKKKLTKTDKFYLAIDELSFSELINQVELLSPDDKLYIFGFDPLIKDLKAIVELRNAVNHNRFLLNYMKFKECSIGSSLYANVKNFAAHLKNEPRNKFILEILDCKEYKASSNKSEEYLKSQSEWKIVESTILDISN
ncbi:MAG: hypothetical protein FWE36_00055 [Erysipelotrichales bacterium]|nr:hypothetical protein [Erysipelotrichales bacterium]